MGFKLICRETCRNGCSGCWYVSMILDSGCGSVYPGVRVGVGWGMVPEWETVICREVVSGSDISGVSLSFRKSFFSKLSTLTPNAAAIFLRLVRLGLALASS